MFKFGQLVNYNKATILSYLLHSWSTNLNSQIILMCWNAFKQNCCWCMSFMFYYMLQTQNRPQITYNPISVYCKDQSIRQINL